MKITFLGTNGWYDTQTGNTICTLAETNDFNLIFDAGNGLYKLDRYLDFNKPTYLFIGHLHVDHIEGLHTLPKVRQKFDLNIYCFEDYLQTLKDFLNHPFTIPPQDLPMNTNIYGFKEGKFTIPFPLQIKRLSHSEPTFGFRITLDNKILTYCCDTGICPNDEQLSANSDLLIHECSLLQKIKPNNWGHSSPKEVAQMALNQGVKKLALTHFAADIYTSLSLRKKAETQSKKILPNSFCASDNLQIQI